jgi:hypothetical protein
MRGATNPGQAAAKEACTMPLILWLLGVPGLIVILLWITGIIGF